MKYKVLIIDDEPPARAIVASCLSGFPEFEICGECGDGFSGLKAIQELHPNLAFLDVQMPKLTGFEMLDLVENPPVIIFCTAFDQYAIKAFEMNAVDYLLKPFSAERFNQAVEKALKALQNPGENKVPGVLKTAEDNPEAIQRIAIRIRHKVVVIPVSDIHFLEADGDYVSIHTKEGKYLKEKTMKFFELHLDPKMFIRIHRSYIVNLTFLDRMEYYDKESYAVLMKNGERLKASTSGYRLLKDALNL
ncbi:MAG: response regulator transcription factor [Bacteroidetes bacterium]|nr:response regulator transcription factor [Bacteroidota bacterium]